MTLSDPNHPKSNYPYLRFGSFFVSLKRLTAKAIAFQFYANVGRVKTNNPQMVVVRVVWPTFKFLGSVVPLKRVKSDICSFVCGLIVVSNSVCHERILPKDVCSGSLTWPLIFGKKVIISRKQLKIEIWLQWRTNMQWYVAYLIAPTLMTLIDLEGHFTL